MLKTIKIKDKEYSKIIELTRQINLVLKYNPTPVNQIEELLDGILFLAIQMENEFIYRGDLLRQMADILEKYGWKKVLVPEPSVN